MNITVFYNGSSCPFQNTEPFYKYSSSHSHTLEHRDHFLCRCLNLSPTLQFPLVLNNVSSLTGFWYCINQRIQELEATLYNALQQETVIKFGELLTEKQQEELRTAVEKLRRQMLRKSREYDCQILQERMELLQQAHQVRKGVKPMCIVSALWYKNIG